MKHLLLPLIMTLVASAAAARGDDALDALMERRVPGLSSRITVVIDATAGADTADSFTIDACQGMPRITANNRVSAAMGLHTYLKRMAGVQLTWDCMTAPLPERLPLPQKPLTMSTAQRLRYYLNYCTHSYSMAHWDFDRWQQEIDWMALHGINAPLTLTGTDAVWHAALLRLGYPDAEARRFVAAPAYQAWWLMNNLEGEGTSMTDQQLGRQAELQRQIMAAMRRLDIEPVLPGYSGMMPHDARRKLHLDVVETGSWCGYHRPSFLLPTDSAFAAVAATYYAEQRRLFGTARYYSMDPFHEGGQTDGVDLHAAALAIDEALRRASAGSVWLVQGWQENPRPELLEAVAPDRLTVLDLHAETVPQWSVRGHHGHPWVWCMLLNFGGNVGLHGKLDHVARAFDAARRSSAPPAGIGLTMEGIENNPVMFELVTDMPWHPERIDTRRWLHDYLTARYGRPSAVADSAWAILARTIYGADGDNRQQGTTESVFCARPSDTPADVSTWAAAEPYYDGRQVVRAAMILAAAADSLADNPHYRYDLVDITRQAVAEAGRLEAKLFSLAAATADSAAYHASADRFMALMALQDRLLATMPQFRLGTWTEAARRAAATPDLADAMERDARRLISTWGSRQASEQGRLHDYGHREWQGLIADLYAPRWRRWFDARLASWGADTLPAIDFYALDAEWVDSHRRYSPEPEGCSVATAIAVARAVAPYAAAGAETTFRQKNLPVSSKNPRLIDKMSVNRLSITRKYLSLGTFYNQ